MNRREFLTESTQAIAGVVVSLASFETTPKHSHTPYCIGNNVWRAIVMKADTPNGNRRIYPKSLIMKIIKTNQDNVKNGTLLGEMDHPIAEHCSVINLDRVSHTVKNIFEENSYLKVDVETLNTPMGETLKLLLENNTVEFRPRGIGGLKCSDENKCIYTVTENYKLVTIDAMARISAAALE